MVIKTYSVIIQNKKTMEAFAKYQPLFMEVLDNDRISVCKWNESGTTIDTAVPELRELTNDKEEWKAVIVRFCDESAMEEFEYSERNPFDFNVNKVMDDNVGESDIPLIRLTHMLGGIPAPDTKFECEIIREEGKEPRTIYRPISNEEGKKAYKKLCKQYEFDGIAPRSIVIISVREKPDEEDHFEHVWTSHRECNSSEFWKRNKYPSICRFAVYDFDKKGPVQREADEFSFWMSVLLLATNEVDPGILQAYRLYRLNLTYNMERMQENFQDAVDRLASARVGLERDIKKEIEREIAVDTKLPNYRLSVPVTIKLPKAIDREVDDTQFPLFSKGTNSDEAMWDINRQKIDEWYNHSVRMADRILDQTAVRMKESCTFEPEEVSCLDKYQVEDMLRETNKLYHEIVEIQGTLPTERTTERPEVARISAQIEECLKGRVVFSRALLAVLVAAALILVSQVPAVFSYIIDYTGSIWGIILFVVIQILIVCFAAALVLQIQKYKLNKLIATYNKFMRAEFACIE